MNLFETEYSGKLYQKVLELARIFQGAKGRALLVGGAVRDALMGRPVKDFDLEVHNLPSTRVLELLQGVCEVDTVGMSFGVIKVKHLDLDISLPRRENKTGAGHRGFLVELDSELTLAEAAARRDFTVNAIMYDPLTGEILDPHGGRSDLEKKVLRHVSCHFSEDPLRVLRGMQFAGRMGFEFAPETIQLCSEITQTELPLERIGSEWEKMLLQGKSISSGMAFLQQCRWIKYYPELEALSPDMWQKTLELLDRCAQLRTHERQKDLVLMGSALTALIPEREKFCRRLWNRQELISRIAAHGGCFISFSEKDVNEIDRAQIRRAALSLKGTELLSLLLQGAMQEEKASFIAGISREEGIFDRAPEPLLTGRHCVELGIAPGPLMGSMLKKCFEAQLEGVFRELETGKEYLRTLKESSGKGR